MIEMFSRLSCHLGVEKAQVALELLKSAVLELAQANPDGITNSDTAKTLGLQSNYLGGSKDYLSWSLLGLLMQEERWFVAITRSTRQRLNEFFLVL